MDKKKIASQILIFVIFFIIIIIGSLIQGNIDNEDLQEATNEFEYENLNINKDELNIFYLDVGQGDSTFITINDCNMLIDSGNEEDGEYIVQFLKSQNISKIDYFVLTHFDEDHIGGAYRILEEFENIGVLYMPGNSNKTKTYKNLIETIDKNNINVDTNIQPSKDIQYSLGNANWRILNVNDGNDLNDSSIVIELSYGTTNYLFMGDATSDVEEKIECNEVDVLKVGHHGSDSSTSKEFLNRINTKYAIISVGNDNAYNLPDKEIIDRLENNNIKVYRTDEDDTIWLTSDGTSIHIDCLEWDVDGNGRKQAIIYKESIYMLSFFELI